jgi:hypothetical protein
LLLAGLVWLRIGTSGERVTVNGVMNLGLYKMQEGSRVTFGSIGMGWLDWLAGWLGLACWWFGSLVGYLFNSTGTRVS